MADVLRYTGEGDDEPVMGEFPTRVCMHAAPLENRFWQATGALIASTRGDDVMAWGTGTSGNDVSIFKPAFFGVDLPDFRPMPREFYSRDTYWWRHELLHRRAMAGYKTLMPEIRADFEKLEEGFFSDSEIVRKAGTHEKFQFVADSRHRAGTARDRWIAKLEKRNDFISNGPYRKMWDRFNRAASMPL